MTPTPHPPLCPQVSLIFPSPQHTRLIVSQSVTNNSHYQLLQGEGNGCGTQVQILYCTVQARLIVNHALETKPSRKGLGHRPWPSGDLTSFQ